MVGEGLEDNLDYSQSIKEIKRCKSNSKNLDKYIFNRLKEVNRKLENVQLLE